MPLRSKYCAAAMRGSSEAVGGPTNNAASTGQAAQCRSRSASAAWPAAVRTAELGEHEAHASLVDVLGRGPAVRPHCELISLPLCARHARGGRHSVAAGKGKVSSRHAQESCQSWPRCVCPRRSARRGARRSYWHEEADLLTCDVGALVQHDRERVAQHGLAHVMVFHCGRFRCGLRLHLAVPCRAAVPWWGSAGSARPGTGTAQRGREHGRGHLPCTAVHGN